MDEATFRYYENYASHYANRTNDCDIEFLLRRFIALLPAQATVLDVGCGPGRDLAIFLRAGFVAIGVDCVPGMIRLASQEAPLTSLVQADIEHLPFVSNSIDGIWACASLVHMSAMQFQRSLGEIMRVSKPGAVTMISIKAGAEEIRDEHGRLFHLFSRGQLLAMLNKAGLAHIAIVENKDQRGQLWFSAFAHCPLAKEQRYGETPLTVRAAMLWGELLLEFLPLAERQLESRLLLEHILAVDDTFLLCHPQHLLSRRQSERFFALLDDRLARIPLAYILGEKGFMSLPFIITTDVLVPRPETELIVEIALAEFSGRPCYGLDIGTGSGCLAISILYYHPQAAMVAIDISLAALQIARQNAQRHGVSNRLSLLQGDMLAPFAHSDNFDLIVSNPPYIPVSDYDSLMPETKAEPSIALVAGDGLDCYRQILQKTCRCLKKGGLLLLELGYGQTQTVQKFVPEGLIVENIVCDYAGIERVMAIRRC